MSQLTDDQDGMLLWIGRGERFVEFDFGNHFGLVSSDSGEHRLFCAVVEPCTIL